MNRRLIIVLQVMTFAHQYHWVQAIYGFGDRPEDEKRIRIYLDEDERLLVPKDSKIEYVSPVVEIDEEVVFEKPPPFLSNFFTTNSVKRPVYPPPFPFYGRPIPEEPYVKPIFTLEDLRIKPDSGSSEFYGNYLGGYDSAYGQPHNGGHAAYVQPQLKPNSVAYGKLLRPILLLPNGWVQGVNLQGDVKPVTEDRPDDLKYDFRTQTHSL